MSDEVAAKPCSTSPFYFSTKVAHSLPGGLFRLFYDSIARTVSAQDGVVFKITP